MPSGHKQDIADLAWSSDNSHQKQRQGLEMPEPAVPEAAMAKTFRAEGVALSDKSTMPDKPVAPEAAMALEAAVAAKPAVTAKAPMAAKSAMAAFEIDGLDARGDA